MFYKGQITANNEDGTYDVQPLLKDSEGKLGIVKGVRALMAAGADNSIVFNYEKDDIVVVALAGYPLEDSLTDQEFFFKENYHNSFIMGKIDMAYEKGIKLMKEDVSIHLKENGKIAISAGGQSLLAILEGILDAMKDNQVLTQMGPQNIMPHNITNVIGLKQKLQQLLDKK